jgi:hypothetical protein
MNSHFQSSEATWTRSGWLARAHVMRANPRNAADQEYGHGRDRPDEHLETTGIREIRSIAGTLIRCTKPESNAKCRKDHRDHDRQHDAKRVEQNLPVGSGDRPFRIEHSFRAATECRGADQDDGN